MAPSSARRPGLTSLIPGLPPGAKEQHPHTWRDAAAKAIRDALRKAGASAGEVAAIGVSGQQHGFVPLDKEGEVIRPAKLWCDTSTAAECDLITQKLGGVKGAIEALGNAVLPGFTAVQDPLAQTQGAGEFRRASPPSCSRTIT